MKKNSITAVLIVLISGIGFGVGWLLKPDSAHRESAKNKDLPAKKSSFVSRKKAPLVTPGKLGRSENRPEKPDHAFRSAETDRTKTDDIKEHFHEALMTRHKAKDEAQIQRLIGALGMTDAQAEKLRVYFERSRAAHSSTDNGGRHEELATALADILTEDQEAAYEEVRKRDRINRIEAHAYRDLAKVQRALDLSSEQKDQVYNALYDRAERRLDSNPNTNAIDEGLGVSIDIPDDFQITPSEDSPGEQPDLQAFREALEENRRRQIDEKVETIAPVLDDRQEEAYRTFLETEGPEVDIVVGGILSNGTKFSASSTSIVIPPPTSKDE